MENVFVTLVNRTSRNLTGRYDGKEHTLPAGSRTSWPEYIALKFKEQNPIMGSENYHTGDKQYLLALVEHGDDESPTEQADSSTLWNKSTIPTPVGTILVEVKGNGFNPMRDRQAGLPPQVPGFEPNNDIPMSSKADKITLDLPFEKP